MSQHIGSIPHESPYDYCCYPDETINDSQLQFSKSIDECSILSEYIDIDSLLDFGTPPQSPCDYPMTFRDGSKAAPEPVSSPCENMKTSKVQPKAELKPTSIPENNSKNLQTLHSISPEIKSQIAHTQASIPAYSNQELNSIFSAQNSTDNLVPVKRTRSKLKIEENPLNNFIRIQKGANISDTDHLDRDQASSQTRDTTYLRKYCPKKDNYLKNLIVKFQNFHEKLDKKAQKLEGMNASERKRENFQRIYNFCLGLRSDTKFVKDLSLRPAHDVGKKSLYKSSEKHKSYNNDFFWTYFENSDVKLAFKLFIEYIFEVESNFQLISYFKFKCCLKNSCLSSCNERWESLKEATLTNYITRPDKDD